MSSQLLIGSDHGGFDLKTRLLDWLSQHYDVRDLGTHCTASIDYPIIASLVATECIKQSSRGILICGTGIGVCIKANRTPGIRAALLYNDFSALMAKQHNDANIVCLGARTTSFNESKRYLSLWLNASFEGGRHLNRIALLDSN